MIVFVGRSVIHYGGVSSLYRFFTKNEELENLLKKKSISIRTSNTGFFLQKIDVHRTKKVDRGPFFLYAV